MSAAINQVVESLTTIERDVVPSEFVNIVMDVLRDRHRQMREEVGDDYEGATRDVVIVTNRFVTVLYR